MTALRTGGCSLLVSQFLLDPWLLSLVSMRADRATERDFFLCCLLFPILQNSQPSAIGRPAATTAQQLGSGCGATIPHSLRGQPRKLHQAAPPLHSSSGEKRTGFRPEGQRAEQRQRGNCRELNLLQALHKSAVAGATCQPAQRSV